MLFRSVSQSRYVGGDLGGDGAEKVGAEGGAEGEGDEGGNGDSARKGDSKLPEKDAGGAALESDGEKNDDETGGDGKDRAGNFLHGLATGFERRHAFLDVADDVFEDDDGVIDDDADGEDEGEEGEDVGAVAEDEQQREGPEDGDGDGGGGDDGGTEVPKKEKDNQNDEKGGDADGLGH